MTSLVTFDGVVVDGVPASLALHPFGCFTTFVVEDRAGTPAVLLWESHLDRLSDGAAELWGHVLERDRVEQELLAHLALAGAGTRSVRVTLYPAAFSLMAPENASGVRHLISSVSVAEQAARGEFRVVEVPFRRHRAHLKSTDLLGQIAARREARLAGFDDALLSDGDRLLEGTTWSLVAWFDDHAVTPDNGVLSSTTVKALADVAQGLGRPLRSAALTRESLFSAALVLGVSVTHPARPVTALGEIDLAVDEELWDRVLRGHRALPRHRLVG